MPVVVGGAPRAIVNRGRDGRPRASACTTAVTKSHFPDNYSVNNQLLIYLQCPHATQVAGYRAWRRLGHQIRKGERGIAILAPCRKVTSVETEDAEEAERVQVLTGFRVVFVFNVSHTDGDELREVRPRHLTGNVPCAWLTRLSSGSPPRASRFCGKRHGRRATATRTSTGGWSW